MARTSYDLKVNRDLIDPNFDGYKLSLESLAISEISLESDLDAPKLSNDLYSYQHLKAFGNHNRLFVDPWNVDAVWFVDQKWQVLVSRLSSASGMSLTLPKIRYTLKDAANRRLIPERINVTLHFTNENFLVICDGTSRLVLLKTGNRIEDSDWKEVYNGQPLGEDTHMSVLHSVWHSIDKTCYVEVLCLHVEKNPDSAKDIHAASFFTKLEWLTLTSENEHIFEVSRTRTLQGTSCPDYAVIDKQGISVIISCEKPIKFIFDSIKPIPNANEGRENGIVKESEDDIQLPAYTWTQKNDEIVVYFKLSSELTKADISFDLESGNVDLRIKNVEPALLTGELFGKVVDSTWTLNDKNTIELFLSKVDREVEWLSVVVGDSRGQRVFDEEQLAIINEQLAPYTSDGSNIDSVGGHKPAFNTQELEECDAFPDDSASVWCLDGETHDIIQQVNLSNHQWLFSAPSIADKFPVVCLRHDVDGVVWQPSFNETGSLEWNHVATFNAFGYVQASKQQKKFSICSPDYSYVAISDCVRHIYIYRQPAAILSPLRNRKTGEKVGAIAKQQVVALESVDSIDGVFATNRNLFALAGKTLYAVRVNND